MHICYMNVCNTAIACKGLTDAAKRGQMEYLLESLIIMFSDSFNNDQPVVVSIYWPDQLITAYVFNKVGDL